MAAPMYLYAKGWRPTSLKAGDQIKATIAPLRQGGPGGMLLEATMLDGTPVAKRTS